MRRNFITGLLGMVVLQAGAAPEAAALELRLEVVDEQGRGLPGVAVRIAPGGTEARSPDNGPRRNTDGTGAVQLLLSLPVEATQRKRPSNFVSSLLSGTEAADAMQIAIEVAHSGRPRLLQVQLYRLRRDGLTVQEGWQVFTPDRSGRFSVQASRPDSTQWRIEDPDGRVASHPGFEPVRCLLEPVDNAAGGARWRLQLTLRRWPDLVVR